MIAICELCGWRGKREELLSGFSPFEEATVYGCPKCKAIDSTRAGCDEPGCLDFGTCGTPTDGKYRWTCHRHIPEPRGGK